MKTTTERIFSAIFIVPQLCVIAFMALTVSPSASALDAFGQELSIPKNSAAGTILARHYFTPMQLCSRSTCTIHSIATYPNGGGSGGGAATLITTNVSGISTRLLINGTAVGSTTAAIKFSRPVEVQLLSDGRQNLGGSLAGEHLHPFYFSISTKEAPGYSSTINLKGTITPIDGTCSVPSQTVKLPKTLIQRLERVDSTAGTQSFQIKINNCPRGYNRIGYTLDPVGGVVANSPGVLPLAGGSTASGIKIRVENAQGAPAIMETSITLDGYKKAAGGSFAIPMQASYIRTDTIATPGTVNGAMTVSLDYQ
ncbi:fimbrial protein [Pseudomonas chlororaphis subsp. aurantiaca]|uniref:fimbrial protein n=1 Tax=Pseudomonas chlororaphis TaxID=587753 RepID=UPI0027DD44A1|nr:fimbrial protein [Pseudomonas chlororaphis]WMI97312.1 fimbrial protein [Pseudomonas chlororaphis subsp. aurantiaca]